MPTGRPTTLDQTASLELESLTVTAEWQINDSHKATMIYGTERWMRPRFRSLMPYLQTFSGLQDLSSKSRKVSSLD